MGRARGSGSRSRTAKSERCLWASLFFLFVRVRIDALERVEHMAESRKSNWRGVRGAAFCHGLSGAVLVTAAAAMLAAPATASIITLSTNSSDVTLASVLDATFDFDVTGITLTLNVTNTTVVPNTFNINEIYFNGSDNVLGLTPEYLPDGWSLLTSQMADGFGVFDFALIYGGPEDGPYVIDPGETKMFTFTISGTAGKGDFVHEFSDASPEQTSAIAAAKFVVGPNDDSAFGALVPAPSALVLLGLAGLRGLRRRRRPT